LGRAIVLAPEGSSVPNGIKAQYYKGDRGTAIDTAFKQMGVGFHGLAGTNSVIGIRNDEYYKDFSTQHGTGATQGGQHDGSLEGYLESIPARLQGYLGHLQKSIYYEPPGERETFVTSYANGIIDNFRDDINKWATANPQEFKVSATYFNYIIQVMDAYQAIFTQAQQAYNQQYQDYLTAEKQWKASNQPRPGEPPPLDPAPHPQMATWPPPGLNLQIPKIQLSYAKKNLQGMTEGVYRGDWVRHPDNPWQIGQIQSIDNGQAAVTWKKTDKRKKAMSSTHAVDALQHARREFSQLTQPTHSKPAVAEGTDNKENPNDQVRNKLNAWMEQDQQFTDPTQRASFQSKVWPYIQQNIKTILADKGEKGNGDYPAAPYAAWLLVQHMDAYPQNQIEFYNALKQAIPDHPKIQFLRDRAAVNQWIMKNANNPEYFINGKALPNPTVNVRNPAMFKDAGIVATSREEALQNAQAAGNKLLVAAVQATNAQTQPSYKQGVTEGESNDTAISLSKLGKFHPGADTLAQFVPERTTAQYALHPDKWESTFYSLTNKDSDKLKYYGPKKILIPPGTLVGDMAIANKFYRAKTTEEKQQYAEAYKASLQPYPVDVSEYRMPELLIPKPGVAEGTELPGDFNLMGQNLFLKNLARNLQQRYPDAIIKLSSDRVTAYHNKGDDERLSVMGTEVMDSGYIGVGLDDAFTESFQGVLVPTIKQTTEQLLAANPGMRPALFLSTDNWNPDAWTHIANKLGYRLVADDESLDEGLLGNMLPWPEVVNKINSAMRAMGWKGQRKDDGSFIFTTRGAMTDEYYIVIIDNEGDSMFTYALGTVEEGDPHIGEQDTLPTTEASVSELMNAVRDGFGLNENFADGRNPGRKGLAKRSGVNTKASVSSLRKTAKNSSGEKQRMAHWLANMKAGRAKAKKK
jgi:hypothetical protein